MQSSCDIGGTGISKSCKKKGGNDAAFNRIFQNASHAEVFVIIFSYFGAEDVRTIVSCWIALRACRVALPKESMLWKTVIFSMMKLRDKRNNKQLCSEPVHSGHLNIEMDVLMDRVQFNFLQSRDRPNYMYLLFLLCGNTKCSKSGCGKYFREIDNVGDSCAYHPGKVRGSSRILSCCREVSFNSPGCKLGRHDGSYFRFVYSARDRPSISTEPSTNSAAPALDTSGKSFCSIDNSTTYGGGGSNTVIDNSMPLPGLSLHHYNPSPLKNIETPSGSGSTKLPQISK